jgi:hypothetical protein
MTEFLKRREQKEMTKAINEDPTPASDTIKAKPTSASSRLGMMTKAIAAMGAMSPEDLSKWFNDSIAQIGKEAESIPDGTAEKNRASVAMKEATDAEINEILKGDDTLSEDTREKVATLFLAALASRAALVEAELQEQAEKEIEERISEIREAIIEKLDEYFSILAEQWLEDNRVAVDESIEVEILRDFQKGLRNLYVESQIEIPEGKLDLVKQLTDKVDELEGRLNEQINKNIEEGKKLRAYEKAELVAEGSTGLTATGVEKMKSLAEGLDFDGDVASFKKKLATVREQYFPAKPGDKVIIEGAELPQANASPSPLAGADDVMKKYVSAITMSLQKG